MYDALFDFCFNHTYFLLLASGIDTNAYISPKKIRKNHSTFNRQKI